jgi:electron transfer flavoprotein beta subunit
VKILVCVKQVPDPNTGEYQIDPGTKRLVRDGATNVLDPGAEVALEAALQLAERAGDSTVTVVTMGPEEAEDALRRALAMGATDGVLITDDDLAGSDALSTAKALAATIREVGYDLILCATESTDGYTGMVPGMVAELLGIPHLSFVRSLDVQGGVLTGQRVVALGYQTVECRLPVLVAIASGSHEPRYPALKGIMAAKRKKVEEYALADLGLEAGAVGGAAARERVLELRPVEERQAGQIVEDDGTGAAQIAALLRQRGVI